MKTRIKTSVQRNQCKAPLLGYAFTGLILCSASVAVQAAEYQRATQPNTQPTYTLKVVTHGENANRSDNMSEPTRQDNRRADVRMQARIQQGTRTITKETSEEITVKVSDAINRTIRLKDGGVIWITKDPASLTPKLNVTSQSSIQMDGDEFSSPINFTIKTNYANFIDRWEMLVYHENDTDNPIATFAGNDLSNGRTLKWNGRIKDNQPLKAGDTLQYVLNVYNKEGQVDETHARKLAITSPQDKSNNSTGFIASQTHKTTTNRVLDNNLKQQTIPLHGSQVRILGRDIAKGNIIKVNDESITVTDNKFFVEKLMPHGKHSFDVAITDNAKENYHKSLNVDVTGKYMFMVALADITAGKGHVTGNLQTLGEGDKHLGGDIFVDGRLAFFLKGKIQGKYLVTAQMDTGTEAIEDLFDGLHKKDPRSIFRRLDPDKYYPVYGDDSTLIDDTDSQGKVFVRVNWDKSRALWGNYNTDFTGTELSAFNRSLYGVKLNHKSLGITEEGDHKTDFTVFASEAQSAFRHNQFLGTGGSLYYLKDTDIVDGSEKVWIEVRERGGSDRAIQKIVMEEGRDYEIDDFQGRIILRRPLLQIAKQSGPSLIKDTPLDGDQILLMVDYEYVPNDFKSDKASYGTRGKVWLTDKLAIGGTYAHENRDQNDYNLKGVDVTLKKGTGTYLKGEYAKSESNQTNASYFSEDGGLNFATFNDATSASNIKGSSYSLEARANLKDFTNVEGSLGAWYKNRTKGFSTSRLNSGVNTRDAGFEALIKATEDLNVSLKATLHDEKTVKETATISVQADYKVTDDLTLSGELRRVREDDKTLANQDGMGYLGAFKVGYDLNKDVNLYAIAQGTLKKRGAYKDNNLVTLGTKAKINNKLDMTAEVSQGDRGRSATLGASYAVNDGYRLYSNYTLSNDKIDQSRSTFTVGQRKTVNDQLKVFTEHQFTRDKKASGIANTFGLDYQINEELTASTSLQTARLDKASSGLTHRDAFSVGLNYKKGKSNASTRLEYRRDKGATENTEQWVSTNQIKYKVNPSLRLQGKLNHSVTKDKIGNSRDARFTEASLGFALRPVDNDRLNVLGRLTYLYDLQPISQSIQPDEQSLIASIESSYQVDQKWEIGGKLAHKKSQIRTNRDTGTWSKNDATLAAARVRYHLTHKWDAMAEYHWMNSQASKDTQHGAMISVDRHIGKNMKVGIGYNFTNFDDDLSNTDGTAKGWFINLVGKF